MASFLCKSALCDFAVNHFIPTLGSLSLIYTAYAPYPSVRKMQQDNILVKFNVMTYPAMVCVALCYLLYGIYFQNYYVLAPNLIVFMATTYYSVSTIRYAPPKQQKVLVLTLVHGLGFVFAVSIFALINFETRTDFIRLILGVLSCTAIILLNTSPFLAIGDLFNHSNALKGSAVVALINGIIWSVYGILISDAYILIANLSGVLSGCIQIGAALSKRSSEPKNPDLEKRAPERVDNIIKVLKDSEIKVITPSNGAELRSVLRTNL